MSTKSLFNLASELGQLLKAKHWEITTAESCTAGGLGFWVTSVSGASDYYKQGFITYSNDAKINMLSVNPITLDDEGAVSEATAIQMAEGALQHSKADISIAVTGIAGPEGGSADKPVGTVWICVANRSSNYRSRIFHFSGDRDNIRNETIRAALMLALEVGRK